MSRRIKATHLMTVTRREQASIGYTDDPSDAVSTIVEDIRVRFVHDDTGYVRGATGEHVIEQPVINAPGRITGEVREGDSVELVPISPRGVEYSDLDATAVSESYGRKSYPVRVQIEVEGV